MSRRESVESDSSTSTNLGPATLADPLHALVAVLMIGDLSVIEVIWAAVAPTMVRSLSDLKYVKA